MTIRTIIPITAALLIFAASAAAQEASLRTLHSFAGYPNDGANPGAGVVVGNAGVLYGVTAEGGSGPCTIQIPGCGVVYSLTPPTNPGGRWTESLLHSFSGYPNDGAYPVGDVVVGSDGVLYGTTSLGGAYNVGTVFSVTPPTSSGDAWTETVLYSFPGGSDGVNPEVGLAISGSVLYGTTLTGGTGVCTGYYIPGCGVVFSLTPSTSRGGNWTEAVIYNFVGTGYAPLAGHIAVGSHGVLYGMTSEGGPMAEGTVFSLKPPSSPGGAWTETVLQNLSSSDGGFQNGGVAIGSGGVLYGTTALGEETVFSLTPPTSQGGVWTETILYGVGGPGGVIIGSGGVLYGTTLDSVFSLAPPASPGGAWTYRVLYTFTGGSDGGYLQAGVALGREGALYGTTEEGGDSGLGTVFQLRP